VSGTDGVSHTFRDSGTFTVKAVAISKNGSKSFAMTKVFIAAPKSEKYVLNMSYNTLFRNGLVEYNFVPLYS
jgi:PKD repeat protein